MWQSRLWILACVPFLTHLPFGDSSSSGLTPSTSGITDLKILCRGDSLSALMLGRHQRQSQKSAFAEPEQQHSREGM